MDLIKLAGQNIWDALEWSVATEWHGEKFFSNNMVQISGEKYTLAKHVFFIPNDSKFVESLQNFFIFFFRFTSDIRHIKTDRTACAISQCFVQ